MDMNDRIRTYYPSLTKSESKVASCVLERSHDLIYLSVTELAEFAGTGETTVMRFAGRLASRDIRISSWLWLRIRPHADHMSYSLRKASLIRSLI